MADGVNFVGTFDNEDIKRKAAEAGKAFERLGASAQKEGSKIDEAFKKAGQYVAGFFTLKAAANFSKQIIQVRSEIQSLEVSFKTLLGDEEKAVKLMADIRKFAANTPMQMNDLAAGAQTLLAFNIEAERVMPILQALGDISMGDSQKFQSLTLAFSQMSSTGRLLGQDLGQMINAGFNPLAQISEKTGKSIGELKQEMAAGKISVDMVTEAFMDATSEGGKFYNMLEQQSKGIQGSFSNVQGALQDMMNELGEKLQEPVTNTLLATQKLIQNYEKVGKVLATLVATYGGYKAAVMAYTVVATVANGLTAGLTAKEIVHLYTVGLLEKAYKKLNLQMLKNPYVLAATAVISLVSAIVLLRKRTDEAKMAQEALNRETNKSFERSEDLKNKVEEYKAILDDDTASELAHYHALQQLKALLPNYLKDVNTYNEYLQRRKELLDGMPQAEDEQENRTLEEKISLLERYEELKKAGQFSGKENYQQFDERIRQDFGSYEEYQKQFNEVKKMVQEFYDSVEDENKGTLDQFVKSTIAADKEILENRKRDQKAAAEAAVPIRQKIELKKEEIDKIQQQVNDLKKKIENNPAKFHVDSEQLTELLSKLGLLKSELAGLEQQQALAPVKDLKAITKAINDANIALVKAQKYAKENGLDSITDKSITDAAANLEQAKKDYKKVTGKDYDQVVKEGKDRLKAQKDVNKAFENEAREFAEWQKKQATQAGFERTQADIDAREDGLEKTLMQINLDYEKQKFAIEENEKDMVERVRRYREAEWAKLNPDKKKGDNPYSVVGSVTAKDLEEEQQTQITEARERALAKRQRLEQKSLKDTLRDYRTYQQQRLDIEEEYARKIEALYEHDENGNRMGLREGVTAEQVANMQQEGRNRIAELESEKLKKSVAYAKFFSSYLVLGADNVRKTAELVKNDLNRQLQAGTITIEQWARGLADVDDIIKKASDRLGGLRAAIYGGVSGLAEYQSELGSQQMAAAQEDYKKAVADFNAAVIAGDKKAIEAAEAQMRAAEAQIEAGRKMKDTADGILDAVSAAKSVLELTMKVGEVLGTAKDEVIKVAESFGADTDSLVADIVNVSVDSVGHAMNAGSKLLNGDVFGALQELVKYVSSVISGINSIIDGERDRTIKGLMSDIDGLEKEYDRLGKAIDKAYGRSKAELIHEQEENLRQQIADLEQARHEEDEKKNTDDEALKDYENNIDERKEKLADLHDAEKAAIFGSDIQSAIESLADALVNAWSEGSSAAEAFKDFARQQTRDMLNMYVRDYISKMTYAADLRKRLEDAMWDGNISDEEWNAINTYAEESGKKIEEALAPVIERIKAIEDEEERRGATKGIAQASQDSVDELNGRFTVIQGHTFALKESTSSIADSTSRLLAVSNDILGTVRHIDTTTTDMHTLMGGMADEMNIMRRSLSHMELEGIRLKK